MTTNMIQQKYVNEPATSAVLVEDQQIQGLPLHQASKLHKAGKLAEARLIYEEVFKLTPEKFEILHLLGTLEAQSRNFDRAIDLLGQAVLKELPLWDTFFNLANALMEVKDYENAIKNYKESLKIKSNNAIVLNNLGLALHQIKSFDEALKNYNKALLIEVDNEKFYFNKGNTLNELKLFEQAIECYKNATIINPNNAYYYYNLGLVQCELKKYEDSLLSFDSVIKLIPNYAEAHLCRGDVLIKLDENEKARDSYEEAIKINPSLSDGYFNLGVAYLNNGNEKEAIKYFESVLKIKPNFAKAMSAIGLAKNNSFDPNGAIEILSKAIHIEPDEPGHYLNRGGVYSSLKKFDLAFEDYGKAIEIKSDYYQAYSNRGNILLSNLNKPEAALILFEVAIGINPDFTDAHINKAEALFRLGYEEEALQSFLRALEIDANASFIIGKCLHYKMKLCDWGNLKEGISIYESMILNNIPAAVPFEAINLTDNPQIHLLAATLLRGKKRQINLILGDIKKRPTKSKIRLGFFSTDLYYHPVSIWLAEQLENFDKSKFELFGFCLNSVHDPMRKRLEAAFDNFIEVDKLPDIDVTKLTRELEIDIAIDLNGQTAGARPNIFAARAAPIQVNHLGFPGTMATDYIDYMITDKASVKNEYRKYYTEKFAYIPCGCTYDRQREISDLPLIREQYGLPENAFVFTCQNGPQKISPEVFDVWMSILKAVPNSVLWLLKPNKLALKNLGDEAEKRGVERSRLIFNERVSVTFDLEKERIGKYLASYRLANLFLDTWPYNAGTTAVDALWAGLPVLTKAGRSMGARMATSSLNALEMTELITENEDEYRNLAIRLAQDRDFLKTIKNKVQQKILTASLFDPVSNTRHIENAFIEMYRRYQVGQEPDDFSIQS